MKAITLLYHDVVNGGDWRSSGFEGGDADIYKLDRAAFERHLDAIAGVIRGAPVAASDLIGGIVTAADEAPRVLLSFDDGGASAYQVTADMLERRGWRGHFFISTDYIGRTAFLTVPQIRALHERGHVIGSHSCSHPPRMAHLPEQGIVNEWARSVDTLANVLGTSVTAASVPCGSYSPTVARAAAQAGIAVLFNSEPTMLIRRVEGCWVAGRFGLQRGDSERSAAALAAATLAPRLRQWAFWNTKKIMKAAGGEAWLALRKKLLAK